MVKESHCIAHGGCHELDGIRVQVIDDAGEVTGNPSSGTNGFLRRMVDRPGED